jgi:hypothetical protein
LRVTQDLIGGSYEGAIAKRRLSLQDRGQSPFGEWDSPERFIGHDGLLPITLLP